MWAKPQQSPSLSLQSEASLHPPLRISTPPQPAVPHPANNPGVFLSPGLAAVPHPSHSQPLAVRLAPSSHASHRATGLWCLMATVPPNKARLTMGPLDSQHLHTQARGVRLSSLSLGQSVEARLTQHRGAESVSQPASLTLHPHMPCQEGCLLVVLHTSLRSDPLGQAVPSQGTSGVRLLCKRMARLHSSQGQHRIMPRPQMSSSSTGLQAYQDPARGLKV